MEKIESKKQQIKEAMREIQNINRQKEILQNELTGYFQILKELGFPRNIVGSVLKEKRKTRFQIESERILFEELEKILED